MKKTNLQKKAEPLPEISSPLQIPKNQAPFLDLTILDIIFRYKSMINNLSEILTFTSKYLKTSE